MLEPRFQVKVNSLLRGGGPTLQLDEARLLRLASAATGGNLASVPEHVIDDVHAVYGPAGVWQLTQMAMSLEKGEFTHFWDVVSNALTFQDQVPLGPEPDYDNDILPQSPLLAKFQWNVVQPSLSRKLYRAGRHHGSVVYGLGGPRILVSHPYRGIDGENYDLYNNSIDVVTSLYLRGFYGTFHFLDYLPGLNYDIEGVNAWLLWFSLIAGHSDLVLYIRQYDDFGASQQDEIEFTPDRVQKKIVEIPHDELRWAKESPEVADLPLFYVGQDGMMTQQEWYAMEAEHAEPLISAYRRAGIPEDALYKIDEAGEITQYPLDYPIYGFDESG